MSNGENGGIENPQILGEVPTLVGGEIQRITDNDQQWATQHVTIIHQGPPEQNSEIQKETTANTSLVSWAVPNTEDATSVQFPISSEGNVIQQV